MNKNNTTRLKQLCEENGLNGSDLWDCHGNWILKHDGVAKIAHKQGIRLKSIDVLNSTETLVRCLVTMVKGDVEISTFGEADKSNCKSKYLACMAEKRGHDRAVLKLINAYEYGIYSEVEADEFKESNNVSNDEVVGRTSSGSSKLSPTNSTAIQLPRQSFRKGATNE